MASPVSHRFFFTSRSINCGLSLMFFFPNQRAYLCIYYICFYATYMCIARTLDVLDRRLWSIWKMYREKSEQPQKISESCWSKTKSICGGSPWSPNGNCHWAACLVKFHCQQSYFIVVFISFVRLRLRNILHGVTLLTWMWLCWLEHTKYIGQLFLWNSGVFTGELFSSLFMSFCLTFAGNTDMRTERASIFEWS